MHNLEQLDVAALKLVKLQALQQGGLSNHNLAFRCAELIYKIEPQNSANFNDIIYYAIYTKKWEDAIRYCLIGLHRKQNYLNSLDGLSHSYYEIKEYEKSGEYGLKALNYRHKQALLNVELPELPKVAPRQGKKVISFSLYGDNPFYTEPAILNAELVKRVYPGWICRFYIDSSVSFYVIQRLLAYGAEVLLCDETLNHIPKTMWRFLVLDDKDVACAIFRDADSVISPRESRAVDEWLNSDKYFHTIRDNGSHTDLVLAGLWGAKCGVLPNIRQMIEHFVSNQELDSRFADQDFLRLYVWKYMIQSLCTHDSLFNFLGNTHAFYGKSHVENFIARTEATSNIDIRGNWADGTVLKWSLYSQIDPLIDEYYTQYQLLEKERLICEYKAVVYDGHLQIRIPKRYAVGIDYGDSRVEVLAL